MFVHVLVRIARSEIGVVGGQQKVVKAAQDTSNLASKKLKEKSLLLGEGLSFLRVYMPEVQEPGRRHPRGGRAKTLEVLGILPKAPRARSTVACALGPSKKICAP